MCFVNKRKIIRKKNRRVSEKNKGYNVQKTHENNVVCQNEYNQQ